MGDDVHMPHTSTAPTEIVRVREQTRTAHYDAIAISAVPSG
jgi:hypothetical protein